MIKNYITLVLLALATGILNNAHSQNNIYNSGWSDTTDIVVNNQTMLFNFPNLTGFPTGNGKLIIRYMGDFGDGGEELSIYNATDDLLLTTSNQRECGELDSVSIEIPYSYLLTQIQNGETQFKVITSYEVDPYNCSESFIQARFEYAYCLHSVPSLSIDNTITSFCRLDEAVALVGTPSGGTFTINGEVVTAFNPSSFNPNSTILVNYALQSESCVVEVNKQFQIKNGPNVEDFVTCPGLPITLPHTSSVHWYYDQGLTQAFDSSQVINQSTTLYYVNPIFNYNFAIEDINETVVDIIDHISFSGDDRGLMAITPNYVYVVGDSYTVRFDATDLANATSLPIRDGIISDLKTGKLYSLWSNDLQDFNSDDMDYYLPTNEITIHGIREMNEELEFVGPLIPFSEPIVHNFNDFGVLLNGYGEFGIFSSTTGNVSIVDLVTLQKNVLALPELNLEVNYNENWAVSGILEKSNGNYSLVFNEDNNLIRVDANSGMVSYLTTDQIEIDYTNFIVSPWNNRMYFHQEYYNEYDEVIGYTTASIIKENLGQSYTNACVNNVTAIVNHIDLGEDVIACQNNLPYMIFAGNGYQSYTWNGVSNNYNVFAAMQAGTYDVAVVDADGCTLKDTIQISIDACLGIDQLNTENSFSVFPNPATSDITIEIPSNLDGQLMLTDMNGKVFYSEVLTTSSQTINVSDLQAGVYFITITNASETQTKRFVKL